MSILRICALGNEMETTASEGIEIEVDLPPSYEESNRMQMQMQMTAGALNEEQTIILEKMLQGCNILISGSAGTGKSYLIRHLCAELDRRGTTYRIVAPTGVAAVNVGGQTIHRFLGIRPEVHNISDYVRLCKRRSKVPWSTLEVIIIDEISMIHPQLFLLFDAIAKLHKQSDRPFGGIQVILIGDFFQLCPIPQKHDRPGDPEYIFETSTWTEMKLEMVLLQKVMRQNDVQFVQALNELRLGRFTPKVVSMIRQCTANKKKRGKHYVKLFALNAQKNLANDTELSKLDTEVRCYNAVDTGNETFLKDCRAEKKITLKLGCPVMLLWNMPAHGLCNGSIGIVEKFDDVGLPTVKFNNGVVISVPQQTWTITEKNPQGRKLLASRTQIPLAVAYSLSQHKAQGLTLDHLIVDCAGIFTTGQLYVALSRASSMDGLIVRNFDPDAIMVDDKVTEFYETLENK